MFVSSNRQQRGQAMSEFIIAMAVFLPLMLGMIYVAKYSDIKHQAIQASRYAAMERALDPSSIHESAQVLTEETRARFFTDQSRNSGKIIYQDTTAGLSTNDTLNPNWSEVNGTPLLTNYTDVTVNVTQQAISSSVMSAVNTTANAMYNLSKSDGQIEASVQVKTAAITHFAPLDNALTISASTYVTGDTWNADGAADVVKHFTELSLPTNDYKQIKTLLTPLSYLFQALSNTDGPQFGCVDADSVPQGELATYKTPAACSN
jgi:hypothetical protein